VVRAEPRAQQQDDAGTEARRLEHAAVEQHRRGSQQVHRRGGRRSADAGRELAVGANVLECAPQEPREWRLTAGSVA